MLINKKKIMLVYTNNFTDFYKSIERYYEDDWELLDFREPWKRNGYLFNAWMVKNYTVDTNAPKD